MPAPEPPCEEGAAPRVVPPPTPSVPEGDAHWVLIETGSNQAFVFSSNKRKVIVGASALIKDACTAWVRKAVDAVEGTPTEVVVSSGKSILLAGSKEDGRAVLQSLTGLALRDAPGLELWGVVVPTGCPDQCTHSDQNCQLGTSLVAAHWELATARAARQHPAARAARTPFTEPCAYTGAAAVAEAKELGGDPVSAQVLACATHPRKKYPWPGVQQDLGRELGTGWIGVLHADGNGLGAIFQHLHEHFHGTDFLRVLSSLSGAVDAVTRQAVERAAEQTQEGVCATAGHEADACRKRAECQWWLPVVVGGDDVTALVRGDVALAFTARILAAFAGLAASQPTFKEVTDKLRLPGLTMSGGLAVVKPSHPFNQAYDLAEQLCSSAKNLPEELRGRAALDAHVLYGSIAQPLARLRRESVAPAVIADADAVPGTWAAAHQFDALQTLADELGRREEERDEAPAGLSSRRSHAIRAALVAGGGDLRVQLDRLPDLWRPRVLAHDSDGWKTDWVDALAFGDVARESGPESGGESGA